MDRTVDRADSVAAAVLVFGLSSDEAAKLRASLPDGLFDVLGSLLRARAAASCSSGEPSPSGSAVPVTPGLLGPSVVQVDRASVTGQLSFSGPHSGAVVMESTANFSSCRANACVYTGKWQYEATIHTAGIQQIGWATLHCQFTPEEGVGDATDSYAYDGKRIRKWHVKCLPYGQAWAAGDVIGSTLDLDRGELTFYRNGMSMGLAYNTVRSMQPHLAYFPAVSLSYTEKCELNFGARPFEHPVPGFLPLTAPPPPSSLSQGEYLVSCFERLVLVAHGIDPPCGGPSPQPGPGGPSPPLPTPCPDDMVLLGAALLEQLSPLLHTSYMVHSLLLPLLLRLLGRTEPHRPQLVATAVQLLYIGLDSALFARCFSLLLEAISLKCVTSTLQPDQFPHSASYPHLTLLCALLRQRSVTPLLLQHPGLHPILEGYLTRKAPSPDDLKALVPHVWWKGCKDEASSEEGMRAASTGLSSALTKVEERQAELLLLLLQGGAGGAGRRRGSASSSDSDGSCGACGGVPPAVLSPLPCAEEPGCQQGYPTSRPVR